MDDKILEYIFKFVLSTFLGGIIGLERELKSKPAGFRTNILICLGSTLYTILSSELSKLIPGLPLDPSRIPGQIVVGIGFIGAGTIIQARGSITGLTTAATIWVVAAIGLAVGAGFYEVAVIFSILVLTVLAVLGRIERAILGKCNSVSMELVIKDKEGKARSKIMEILEEFEIKAEQYQISETDDKLQLKLNYCDKHPAHHRFIFEIMKIPYIKEIKSGVEHQ